MNGNGTFNPQILVDKLAKLNSSQQSIETLSHWCIFHRKKARQVVETWDQQFHYSPIEQRISFLYLANDILQNSRRKGLEFVTEFWKVLPGALNDVIEKGDDFGRKIALRLVDIWEDRKVFGSHGHILKEELLGRNSEKRNSIGTKAVYELKHPAGELLEKIIASYELICPMDEDALFGRCSEAISSIEKMEKEIGNDFSLGNINGFGSAEELNGWFNIIRDFIEQLKVVESSRMALQSHLREALHEQELKTKQVREQLQVALSRYDRASNIIQRLQMKDTSQSLPEKKPKEPSPPASDQPSAVLPSEDEQRKSTAAEVAAKLTASKSSAQMLSYVLSSLASEGIITKKPKVETDVLPYVRTPPPFPHPGSINPPPPPPPILPLMPPMLPSAASRFVQTGGPMMAAVHSYPWPPYPPIGMPPYPLPPPPPKGLQSFQTSPPPLSRQ